MTNRARLVVSLAIAGLAHTAPAPADACTGPLLLHCSGAGASAAPADAQLFVFRGAYDASVSGGLKRITTEPQLRLTNSTGAEVPFALSADANLPGYWLVRPSVTIAAGEKYTLAWGPVCSPEQLASAMDVNREKAAGDRVELTVPPAAPLPTSLGELVIDAPHREQGGLCSCDALRGPFEQLSIGVRLTPEVLDALAPYEGLISMQRTVDGTAVEEPSWARRATTCDSTALRASCTSGVDTGIAPGVHEVGYRVFFAGKKDPLTVEQTVNFDCGPGPELPGTGDAGPAGEATAGGGSSSCATGRPAPGRPAPFLVLLALASCAWMRRFRRNR